MTKPFCDEGKLLAKAADDTVTLIHATREVPAIKNLVTAHDILTLSIEIFHHYAKYHYGYIPWDRSAFKDLDRIRCETVTLYGDTFRPTSLVTYWYKELGSLFRVLNVSSN